MVTDRTVPRVQGTALVLVMWLLALLTTLIGTFAASAHIEALQGRQLRTSTAARYAAQAGIELAVLRLLDDNQSTRWIPDGREYALTFEGASLRILVTDESGKIDLNTADADLLSRLFVVLQVAEPRARALAGAIIDWRDADSLVQINGAEDRAYAQAGLPYRPKNRSFDSNAELQQVVGMDYALYRKAADLVTVHSGESRPNPVFAPALVLLALGMDSAQAASTVAQRQAYRPGSGQPLPRFPNGGPIQVPMGSGTYSISSRAIQADRTTVELFATVRAGVAGPYGHLYAPLQWREGELP